MDAFPVVQCAVVQAGLATAAVYWRIRITLNKTYTTRPSGTKHVTQWLNPLSKQFHFPPPPNCGYSLVTLSHAVVHLLIKIMTQSYLGPIWVMPAAASCCERKVKKKFTCLFCCCEVTMFRSLVQIPHPDLNCSMGYVTPRMDVPDLVEDTKPRIPVLPSPICAW